MRRPTPPGGFTDAGNDHTYVRKIDGRIVQNNDGAAPNCSDSQNAKTPMDIFGNDEEGY